MPVKITKLNYVSGLILYFASLHFINIVYIEQITNFVIFGTLSNC